MFVRVWKFHPAAGRRDEFETAYGPAGDWATLFARGAGFRGTQLLRSTTRTDEYITLDHWDSRDAWDAFRRANASDYEALDRRCENLTAAEECVGDYVDVGGATGDD